MFLQLPFISFDIHTLSLESQTSWHKLMWPNSQHDQNPHKIPGRIACIPCFYETVVQVVYSEDSPITCSLLSLYTYSREEEPRPCSFPIGRKLHCCPLQWKTQSLSWMQSWKMRTKSWLMKLIMVINSKEFNGITKSKNYWEGSVHGQMLIIEHISQVFGETALNISSSPPNFH